MSESLHAGTVVPSSERGDVSTEYLMSGISIDAEHHADTSAAAVLAVAVDAGHAAHHAQSHHAAPATFAESGARSRPAPV